jgi:hypothetical protein
VPEVVKFDELRVPRIMIEKNRFAVKRCDVWYLVRYVNGFTVLDWIRKDTSMVPGVYISIEDLVKEVFKDYDVVAVYSDAVLACKVSENGVICRMHGDSFIR